MHPDRWTSTIKKREEDFGDFKSPNILQRAKRQITNIAESPREPLRPGPLKLRRPNGTLQDPPLPHPTNERGESAAAAELARKPVVATSHAGDPLAAGGGPHVPAVNKLLAITSGPLGMAAAAPLSVDPKKVEEVKESFDGGFLPPPKDASDIDFSPTPQQELLSDTMAAPLITVGEVANDALSRLANARRWAADDFTTQDDNPVYRYETPDGEKFTSADLRPFYDLGDGIPRDQEYLKQGGVAVDADKNGDYTKVKMNADGAVVPREMVENPAFIGNGLSPKYINEQVDDLWRTQINEKGGLIGVANPRSPFQDRTSKWPWEEGFNPRDLALDESLEWGVDLGLGSAPYYGPPPVRYGAGIARGLGPALGYNSESYMPVAPGLERLDQLGEGGYSPDRMNVGQSIAGAITPGAEAWAEYGLTGTAVGGALKAAKAIPKPIRKSITEGMIGQTLGPFGRSAPVRALVGGISEGSEELVSIIPSMISQDGLKNLGRERIFNDETQRFNYGDGSLGTRLGNIGEAAGEAFLSGFAMGFPMSGGVEAKNYYDRKMSGQKPDIPLPEIPVAPRRDGQPQSERIAAFQAERAR